MTSSPETSWRDGVSQQVQDDLDGLLDEALTPARQLIAEHGELLPFGVALPDAAEPWLVGADPGLGEQPASTTVLDVMVEGLRAARDELRAVALVSDVRLRDSDAIRVELEHREGPAICVLLPYRRRRFRGTEWAELQAGPGTAHVWP